MTSPGDDDRAFRDFLWICRAALDAEPASAQARIAEAMRALLASGWAMPDGRYRTKQPDAPYGSYLLYRDPDFVVILDVFAAGQTTDIHNHDTWAVVGLVVGAEEDEIFRGNPAVGAPPQPVRGQRSAPGDVVAYPPDVFHRLRTAHGTDSVSLHVYGADVGEAERLAWDETAQRYATFRSGYSNEAVGVPVYVERL
jgi:predicted metal-dependent enzyme (double-stranded beta helix superfamily)